MTCQLKVVHVDTVMKLDIKAFSAVSLNLCIKGSVSKHTLSIKDNNVLCYYEQIHSINDMLASEIRQQSKASEFSKNIYK